MGEQPQPKAVEEGVKDATKTAPDAWNVVEFTTDEIPWEEKTGAQKVTFLAILFFKIVLATLITYLFIISLGLMANSFRILGGKTSGRAFRDSELFDNPLAGLVTGILVTVLVQSSSTSTSIIVSMTAGNLIEVKNAIPMIMGANIGTSVTNTLVSLGSFGNKDEYRRAFAGATVHDCFNFLTVMTLLPIEAVTGLLRHIAAGICDGMGVTDDEEKGAKTDFLKKLTKPASAHLLGIDKKLITAIAKEDDIEKLKKYEETSIIKHKQKDDNHIFMDTPMSDGVAGILMVLVSLAFLCICLMLLVRVLQTIFRGRIAIWFRTALNLEFQSVPFLANYVLILFGTAITILFQSSSVTTSTLTPLVGIGLVRIDKMFAFTIGANVGTTITGILSALVSDKRKTGLTVAFAHTLFNVVGTLIWYPVPAIRNIPIGMAKTLGNIAAEWKWFPIAYVIFAFLAMPAILMGLSAASPWLCVFVGLPMLILIIIATIVVGLRISRPQALPDFLKKDAGWMPNAIRMEKRPESNSEDTNSRTNMAASADLGKDNWQLSAAAWGTGWFVVLCLLMVCFNAKWADLKYKSWDKRNHYGISAWSACSYAFKDDMAWAPVLDGSACTLGKTDSCGAEDMGDCQKSGFSSAPNAHEAYQGSWAACREICTTDQWMEWCEALKCSGSDHDLQCQNVTKTVHRAYDVAYGPANGLAWEGGEMCRDLGDICTEVDGPIKAAGDLSVAALVFAAIAQASVLVYSYQQDKTKLLMVACGLFSLAWVLLLASWASFAGTLGQDTTCIVEAESRLGAVMANGKFGDIINGGTGSYTYGYVIGCWCLLPVTIALCAMRIKSDLQKSTS
eukprot:gnl/TRDRNA2_/TRDRNA2_178057_c0_seq9.p1 gnl/TRDRNA2_/TRDRNA2_178057_c0~~gnl/TRDRNA2_/TRDRNA2_178057_c0_seq9.p1  ORF type:complete len:897 (+),score=140.98 gnl/TRDRNA2_/TRDRNA2_178057_c0_seq9:156-2693(+)